MLAVARVGLALLLAQGPAAGAAETKVSSSNAIRHVLQPVFADFERASGHKVAAQYEGSLVTRRDIEAGAAFDVDELIRLGKIEPGSRVVLGYTGVGVGVRQGAPKPDIATTEAFNRALLDARSVAYSRGTSGAYFLALLDRLGIRAAMQSKLRPQLAGQYRGCRGERRGCDRRVQGERPRTEQAAIVDFYDSLAPLYHLVYEDWEASINRQATALDSIIRSALGEGRHRIRDVACGIGTQSLGLAALGYRVTASDLSHAAVQRARQEAASRRLSIDFSVGDMRAPSGGEFDVVLCADNSLPHLLDDDDIAEAMRAFHAALRPGGLCLVSVRDYAALEHGGTQLKPHGVRAGNGKRWLLFQVWEWRGEIYDLRFYFIEDDGHGACRAHVFRSSCYAISIERLTELMREAGFEQVRRIDDVFFQPIVCGRKRQ